MLDGRWPVAQQASATLPYGVQLPNTGLDASLAPLALQSLLERNRDRTGHGLARNERQLTGQPTGLFVLDIGARRAP